jgi:hypothetical protein
VAVIVPDVLALCAAAVNVTAVVTVDAEAGDTLPIPAGPAARVVLAGRTVPAVVYLAVKVNEAVLCPSASTVPVAGLSVSVMPLSVIVELAVSVPYVAVTVAELSVGSPGAVYVIVVVAAEPFAAGDTEPRPAGLTATVAAPVVMAAPLVVYLAVSVSGVVLWPSASTVAEAGVSVSVMPLTLIVDVAVNPL